MSSFTLTGPSRTLAEAFDIYFKIKQRRPAYITALNALKEITMPLHAKLLRDITLEEIDSLLANMAPAHRNQRIRELRAIFNYGVKKRWLTENPIFRLDFTALQVGEPNIYEPVEIGKLLKTAAATNPRLIPLICIGSFAGIRPEERLRTEWKDIDLEERSIDLSGEQTKKGRRRSIPINRTLLAWLKWYLLKYGKQKGRVSDWKSIWTIRRPMKRLHEEAEVPIRANGFRHSFASYHLAQHGDIDSLVIALGHKGDATLLWEHYHRHVRKSAAKAYWALTPPKVLKNSEQ